MFLLFFSFVDLFRIFSSLSLIFFILSSAQEQWQVQNLDHKMKKKPQKQAVSNGVF